MGDCSSHPRAVAQVLRLDIGLYPELAFQDLAAIIVFPHRR
jgi:hypothetical protein